jgi:predicted MFS family arabinose efflux permease
VSDEADTSSQGNGPESRLRGTWLVVSVVTTIQIIVSGATLTLAAIAPVVADSLGVPTSTIGIQVGLIYGAGILTNLLVGTPIRRWGGCRTSQISLSLATAGCLMAAVPHIAATIAASLLIGFAAGLTNPSGSHLLARFTAIKRRNLIFSIKQTGVPLGGVLAGLIAPPVTLAFGWQWAPVIVAGMAFVLMIVLQALRRNWDDDRLAAGDAPPPFNPLHGFMLMWRLAPLRWLAIMSFFFAMVQFCLTTFLVTLLVEDLALSLISAGILLSLSQISGVVGRVTWGWVADRLGNGLSLLVGAGTVSVLGTALTGFMSPDWPVLAVQGVFIVTSFCAIGWNGVFLAEIARLSPPGQVGAATGGSLAINYAGVMIGPPLFAAIYFAVGSYTMSVAVLALFAAAGIFSALRCRALQSPRRGGGS